MFAVLAQDLGRARELRYNTPWYHGGCYPIHWFVYCWCTQMPCVRTDKFISYRVFVQLSPRTRTEVIQNKYVPSSISPFSIFLSLSYKPSARSTHIRGNGMQPLRQICRRRATPRPDPAAWHPRRISAGLNELPWQRRAATEGN